MKLKRNSEIYQNICALRQPLFVLTFLVYMVAPSVGSAATKIFIQNDTGETIHVIEVSIAGDPLNKKAWKKEKDTIPAGKRVNVLSINRTGKFNWMDPTPRFIEPGKTVIFTIKLRSGDDSELLTLKHKLLGTGSNSKLWYSIENESGDLEWLLPFNEVSGTWLGDDSVKMNYILRAVETDSDDNLELVVKN